MKGGQESVLGKLALLARGAAGKVGADDGQLARWRVKAQLHVAPFGVKFGRVKTDDHVAGRVARVDADARIALFLRKMKVALQTGQLLEFALHVGCNRLEFLHANTIRLRGGHPFFDPFAGGRADAVKVEAG